MQRRRQSGRRPHAAALTVARRGATHAVSRGATRCSSREEAARRRRHAAGTAPEVAAAWRSDETKPRVSSGRLWMICR